VSVNRQQNLPACVRHPDRPTGLRCVRCDRPACTDCLREASVGHQCVDCVNEGVKSVRPARTVSGARESRGRRLVVVPALTLVNVVVFAATALQAGSIVDNVRSTLFEDGALVPAFVSAGEWWRLVTSGFLHFGSYNGYGPVHLLFNMVALWVIGRNLEVQLGRGRFLAVYLLALLGGSTAVMLFGDAGGVVAGASGAIYGIFGGIAVIVIKSKINPTAVLTLIAISIFLSVAMPGISLLGHVGGLVVGALATAAMVYSPPARRFQVQLAACIALLVIMLVAVALRGSAMDCQVDGHLYYFCNG
jgi:membrane associated rhomboid family serine protease